MRLLLDTHIAVWAVARLELLPDTVVDLIADSENEVAVSIASLLEIVIKNNLERTARDPFPLTFDEACRAFARAGLTIVPIELRHLAAVEHLPPVHRDPFDRLLVATATADTYRLLTRDLRLAAYGNHVMLV